MDRAKEVFAHQTTWRVPAFGPGIGEHEVERGHGILREQPLNRVGNLEQKDSRIRQAAALDPATGSADPPYETLDPQEICTGILSRDCRKKRTISTAKIDYDRRATSINLRQVEQRGTIRRDEFRLACYTVGGIGGEHVR